MVSTAADEGSDRKANLYTLLQMSPGISLELYHIEITRDF